MEYEDFELQIGPCSPEGALVRVLRSPAGEGEDRLRLEEVAGSLGAAGRGLTRDFGTVRPAPELSPEEVGGRLFHSLFTGQVGNLFRQSLGRIGSEAPGRGLRIRLRINPRDPSLEPLRSIPWELLYRTDTEDFLALSRRTPVVRALDVPRASPPPLIHPPLRVLVVSSPGPDGDLELEDELKQLVLALRRNRNIEVEELDRLETNALRQAFHRKPFHVLHYMGHGAFDPKTGEGTLLLGRPGSEAERVSGRHLATKIKDFADVRLVVLNACRSAQSEMGAGSRPFAGVATALLLGGVSAVVAMQSPIPDSQAVAFSAAFYDGLTRGAPVEAAVTEGRQAIHSLAPDDADWAVPVLFLQSASGSVVVPWPEDPPDVVRSSWKRRIAMLLPIPLLATSAALLARPEEPQQSFTVLRDRPPTPQKSSVQPRSPKVVQSGPPPFRAVRRRSLHKRLPQRLEQRRPEAQCGSKGSDGTSRRGRA